MTTSTTRKTTLRASELSCPSCVAKIEKVLESLDGVTDAKVHFETGRIVVEHTADKASKEALVAAVASAGYQAKVSAF
jgi:copper chaperone CopZ